MAALDEDDLALRFGPPKTDATREAHQEVRSVLYEAALALMNETKPGREQSLMVTALEEAMFWANASIARSPENQ